MKILFTLILLLSYGTLSAQESGWYKQNSGVTKALGRVQFINKDTGWAGSLYTSNGGETWATYQNGRYVHQFTDNRHGWAYSTKGSQWVARTTDGGETWEDHQITNLDHGSIDAIYFCDSLTGYVSYFEYIGATHDGGKTWEMTLVTDGTDEILTFGCFNPMRVNAGGHSSDIGPNRRVYNAFTTDGGKTWIRLDYPTYAMTYYDFAVTDSFTIYGVGQRILRSTNRGFTWKTILDTSSQYLGFYAISASDSGNITAVGPNGVIVRTKDGWKTHEFQNSNVTYDLSDVFFIDSTTGWIVGDIGTTLHTTNAGKSWVQQFIPKPLTTSVTPEPFARKTSISYELPSAAKVKIHIYDILGKELEVLESPGIQDADTHTIEFDGSRYPEGTFHYQIETDGFYGMGKMTKVVY